MKPLHLVRHCSSCQDPEPDEVAVDRLLHRRMAWSVAHRADRVEACRRLVDKGCTDADMAYRFTTNCQAVQRLLKEIKTA